MFNENIFKKYDLRGAYPNELNEEMAYQIGKGFALYSKTKKIITGHDARLSSSSLKNSLIQGITDQGADAVDIGLCSTSCFYYTVATSGLDGGIMVTASHAPKIFNGFKPLLKNGTPLTKEQILDFKKITLENKNTKTTARGVILKKNPTDDYVKAVKSSLKTKIKPMKIVMDSGNGTAGLYIDKIFAGIGVNFISIFPEPDGNFPNHETNPKIPENRAKLKEAIISEKADLGFMFDGDADRLYILDRKGEVIDPSLVLAIIAEYLVKNSSNKKVVAEVRTSRVLKDTIEKLGGKVEISTCWTIPIKLKMKSDAEIVFGGETSGHYIFREMGDSDDGVFAALTFLQAISANEKNIDEIIRNFKENYFVIEETNFKMDSFDEADAILNKLRKKYSREGADISEIDGLSVIFPDWWFNLRMSETEPFLRLNLEAKTKEIMEKKKDEILNLIKK